MRNPHSFSGHQAHASSQRAECAGARSDPFRDVDVETMAEMFDTRRWSAGGAITAIKAALWYAPSGHGLGADALRCRNFQGCEQV